MLFRAIGYTDKEVISKMEVDFRTALGDENPHSHFSFYPRFEDLPNLKRITENDYWWYHSSHTAKADVYVGRQLKRIEIDGVSDWRDLFIYWHDRESLKGGGHAVLWCYNQKTTHYFEWKACDHTFESRNVGNCLTRYTCSKCGTSHDVDSSG